MADIKRGPVRRHIELLNSYTKHLVDGLCPTSGIQYSPVATLGTATLSVLDILIDPGVDFALQEIEVGLTQKFTNLKDAVGSLTYFWEARQESIATTRAYTRITADITKGIGSLSNSEDTFSGYINVGSVSEAPIRLRLMAVGLAASSMECKVKSSSYVQLLGVIIPGA